MRRTSGSVRDRVGHAPRGPAQQATGRRDRELPGPGDTAAGRFDSVDKPVILVARDRFETASTKVGIRSKGEAGSERLIMAGEGIMNYWRAQTLKFGL